MPRISDHYMQRWIHMFNEMELLLNNIFNKTHPSVQIIVILLAAFFMSYYWGILPQKFYDWIENKKEKENLFTIAFNLTGQPITAIFFNGKYIGAFDIDNKLLPIENIQTLDDFFTELATQSNANIEFIQPK